MVKRTITSVVMFAIGLPLLLLGGIPYFIFITFLLVAAGWEYMNMMRAVDGQTPRGLLLALLLGLIITRSFFGGYGDTMLTLSVMLLMAWHLFEYERGRERAAFDFAVSVVILVYIGWVGSYLILLRALPDGGWWLMLCLMCVWLADTGAYLLGSAYGKHKMSPRLSPHKSWEGYFGGVFSAVLMGSFFAYSFSRWGPLHLQPWHGAVLGLIIGGLSPLGDLGKSMIKRLAGLKDSGTLIPGHGGAFDRIDSWIWAAVIGLLIVQTWLL